MSLRQFSCLTGTTKLVLVRMFGGNFTGLVGRVSLKQLSFLIGPNKLVFVCIILLLV